MFSELCLHWCLCLYAEDTENGAQALYQLHSEVRQLKVCMFLFMIIFMVTFNVMFLKLLQRQVQDQVAGQDAGSTELRTFIRRCLVLKQRTTEDIDRLKKHYEKYGYKPRKARQENTGKQFFCHLFNLI